MKLIFSSYSILSCSDKGQFGNDLLLLEGREEKSKFFQLLSEGTKIFCSGTLHTVASCLGPVIPICSIPSPFARTIVSVPSRIRAAEYLHKSALFQDSFDVMLLNLNSLDPFLAENCSAIETKDPHLKDFDIWYIDIKCVNSDNTHNLVIMQIGAQHKKGDERAKEHLFMGTHNKSADEQEQSILEAFVAFLARNPWYWVPSPTCLCSPFSSPA